MIDDQTITERLEAMKQPNDKRVLWPENCAGSSKALAIFIGPSPGGKKVDTRREIELLSAQPLWNEPYMEPLGWSKGFQVSFKPIVKEIFQRKFKVAAKLIARFNMDWLQNPESQDVSYRYMWEGCSHILPILYECQPELVIPMDEKSFGVLQMALFNDGYEIFPARTGLINVQIAQKGNLRQHKKIMAFKAVKEATSFLVIKSLQHPARIYNAEYAKRVGQAIRLTAEKMWNDDVVNLNL